MIKVPKGLPVKFWVEGEQTFNEKEQYGVDKHYYLQKYPCDKQLTIQVQDDAVRGYNVKVVESATVYHYVPMTREEKGGTYIYTATFTMNSIGVCEKCVSIEIVAIETVINGTLSDENDAITGNMLVITDVFEVSGTLTDANDGISGSVTWNTFNSASFGLNPSPCAFVYTLYWSGTWGTGTQMYWDATLSTPVTGYSTIAPEWSGEH